MRVIDFIEASDPVLIMPYYELGNLQTWDPVDNYAYVRAFLQILLALQWLHSRRAVHRDIKPENFLIDAETPLNIIMADFGLSNVATDHLLRTFCGTLEYCAPEVFPGNSDGYGAKADIWSLGVMMLRLIYRLPDTPKLSSLTSYARLRKWIKIWSTRLRDELDAWNDDYDLVIDILFHMLEDDPQKRFTAEQCLQTGLENGLFRRNRDGYIILATDTEVSTPAEAAWQTDSPADQTKTPTPQSPQLAGTPATNQSLASTVGTERLWEDSVRQCELAPDENASKNAPLSTESSNSGPSKHRQKTSTSSWSWTIGLGNSDSAGDVATGLFITKDDFTPSLESQLASEHKPQECATVRQASPALPESEQAIGENVGLASFEQRVFELLA